MNKTRILLQAKSNPALQFMQIQILCFLYIFNHKEK